MVGEWTRWDWSGVIAVIGWAAVCTVGLGWVLRRWGERVFVAAAVAVSLAAGLGWAWATREMGRWPVDSGLYRWFLDQLAEGGFSVDNLRTLAGKTDYVLWVDRAFPLYPLRFWTGHAGFGLAVQVAQAVAGALCALAAWRTARLLFGARVACWTLTAMVAMPAATLQVVGLNHQVWGSLYFAAGVWLLAEWMHGGGGRKTRLGLALLSLAVVLALCMEGYAGKMFLIVATVLLGGECLRTTAGRKWAAGAFVLLVMIPGMLAWVGMHVLHSRLVVLDDAPSHGGQLAFCARGLGTGVWGEYAEDLDWLDITTPPGEKELLFKRFIASQCAWNGKVLAAKLFPAKLAKFMLAGYASLAEEVLWANGAERTARVARGARVGWFLLLYGPLMLWGLQRLAGRLEDGRAAWCLLPVALFAGAVMFAGETSPRYSMPIQSLLLAAGAAGLAGGRGGAAERKASRFRFAAGVALAGGAYLVFAGVLLGMRGTWAKAGFEDMRSATLTGGRPAEDPLLAPFEAVFPDGQGVAEWPGRGGCGIVHLRGTSWRDHGRVVAEWGEGAACEVSLPARLETDWGADGARTLAFRRIDSEGSVAVGYVSVQAAGNSATGDAATDLGGQNSD